MIALWLHLCTRQICPLYFMNSIHFLKYSKTIVLSNKRSGRRAFQTLLSKLCTFQVKHSDGFRCFLPLLNDACAFLHRQTTFSSTAAFLQLIILLCYCEFHSLMRTNEKKKLWNSEPFTMIDSTKWGYAVKRCFELWMQHINVPVFML